MKIIAQALGVVRRLSPHCRDAARVISESADVHPPMLDRIGMRLHVLVCAPCRCYWRSTRILKEKMKQIADLPLPEPKQPMPTQTKARIRAVLQAVEPGSSSDQSSI